MVLLVAAQDRKATPGGGDAERAALHKAMVAYTGRWRLEGGRFIVAVDTSWNKAWEGTEQARDIRFDEQGRLLMEARGTGVFDRPDTPWVARLTFVREW
jgi:Lipocalin-like domain